MSASIDKPDAQKPERISYRVKEALEVAGVGRTWLYGRIGDGSLKTVKVRGVRLIPRANLLALMGVEPSGMEASR